MPSLSLCLIARDEEELLPACLASVAGVVDEIVVVDTGSSDATAAVARACGARVLSEPWADDFAAARNASLGAARGDFVLVLDADERLASGGGPALRVALRDADFDCGMIRLHNAGSLSASEAEVLSGAARLGPPIELPRLLRRAQGLRYDGVVHESVSDWLAARGMRLRSLDADIVHLGAVPELRRARGKEERNLGLLRRRCALERHNVTPFGYLALELASNAHMDEAREVAEAGWSLLARKPRDRSVLRLCVARALVALHDDDPTRALESVSCAQRVDGPTPDLDFLRGRALLRAALDEGVEGRARALQEAAAAFQGALDDPRAVATRRYISGASGWASACGLGAVRLWQGGRAAAAREAFVRALRELPGCPEALLGAIELELDLGEAGGALRKLEPLLDHRPDGWLLAAEAAAALGAAPDALALLAEARRRSVRWFAPHRQERMEALARRLEASACAEPGR